ncbi:MAG: hypothetical protein KDJ17_00150 [Hyphomicrobiaceae bacterium]|nr:hypothetical protein [Hyphomicrobiaceae bacterium]
MRAKFAILTALLLAMLCAGELIDAAHANWLTALTKGATKAGKAASHTHLGDIGKAISHVPHLPPGSRGVALAAHATSDGHWQFATREGNVFTAATPDEMKRMLPSLVPDAPSDGKMALYLSEDSAFANRSALDKLPPDAELHLTTSEGAFPLTQAGDGALSLKLKPNVTIALGERGLFEEALSFLSRPLNKSSIRTLSIEPGATKPLSSAPRLDPASKAPVVDKVAPEQLAQSLRALRGQTALVVGRIENGKIAFKPASGSEVVSDLDGLLAAARDADVNLVLLNADTPLQPGGRNWLWQSIEVGGLNEAMSKATFGDFLDALGAHRVPMRVSATPDGSGRVRLQAQAESTAGAVESAQNALSDFLGDLTGNVVTNAVDVHARDESRQKELDARIIPGVPTYIQYPYLIAVFLGMLGWGVSRSWWSAIWPPRTPQGGENWVVGKLRALPNFLAFVFLFLPLAGIPAFVWHSLVQLWNTISAPFRWIGRLMRRRVEV